MASQLAWRSSVAARFAIGASASAAAMSRMLAPSRKASVVMRCGARSRRSRATATSVPTSPMAMNTSSTPPATRAPRLSVRGVSTGGAALAAETGFLEEEVIVRVPGLQNWK